MVSTPIGNLQDISKRALSVLTEVDEVVCEELRVGSTLMKRLGIDTPITLLNEHNETGQTTILLKSLKQGKTLALISDAGTPVFADPGLELVRGAIRLKASVIPVPGASSLMSALVCSGFSLNEFHFAGFLPRQTGARLDRLKSLREIRTLLIIPDFYQKMLKLGLFAQIVRYLKITPKILSGARNVLGTPNLDQ